MRVLPEVTTENLPFWTGGARGELMIARCSDCLHSIHPPQMICPSCWSRNIGPHAAIGTGTVYSYTVNHQAWLPGMKVPFALVVVAIDGEPGVRVIGEFLGALDQIAIGLRVRAIFLQVDDVWIPQWLPEAGQ